MIELNLPMQDRVIVITGGSIGIGREMGRAFAAQGVMFVKQLGEQTAYRGTLFSNAKLLNSNG